jgi:hypothetical protein
MDFEYIREQINREWAEFQKTHPPAPKSEDQRLRSQKRAEISEAFLSGRITINTARRQMRRYYEHG